MSRFTYIVILLTVLISAPLRGAEPPYELDFDELQLAVEQLDCIVEPNYDEIVESYLNRYLKSSRKYTAKMLGRASIYFPIFEAYLQSAGLPDDLKYLPIVESALNPTGTSRVGAQGLWQFMPSTAPEFGMVLNTEVDERMDTHLATMGALKYLQKSYERYESWELALASYNAGPGRVNRAIRRARSTKFSRVKRYLPRETRNYVPAFIAATFLMKKYAEYDLEPQEPELDLVLTETMVITEPISFAQINRVTGISIPIIKRLNPSYIHDCIPFKDGGAYLILPKRVLPAMLEYLDIRSIGDQNKSPKSSGKWTIVHETPTLAGKYKRVQMITNTPVSTSEIATALEVSPFLLAKWNPSWRLEDTLQLQTVFYQFEPTQYIHLEQTLWYELAPISSRPLRVLDTPISLQANSTSFGQFKAGIGQSQWFVPAYTLPIRALFDKFPSLDQSYVYRKNKLQRDDLLQPGQAIRIK